MTQVPKDAFHRAVMFRCEVCRVPFLSEEDLKAHAKTHEKPFTFMGIPVVVTEHVPPGTCLCCEVPIQDGKAFLDQLEKMVGRSLRGEFEG